MRHLILLALLLTSCSGGDVAHQSEAKERIRAQLIDPGSAEFRNLTNVKRKDGWIVCGEVNSKNRFGGYVGFSKFSVTEKAGDELIVKKDDSIESAVAEALIDNLCGFKST